MSSLNLRAVATTLLCVPGVLTIKLNVHSQQSIKQVAHKLASGVVDDYSGNSSHGVFYDQSSVVAWAQSALAWDALINYCALTGDKTYVDLAASALVAQTGPGKDFMPKDLSNKMHSQSKYDSIGNVDQSYWALAAMTAAETALSPSRGQKVAWVELAKNVFDIQATRWDTDTCGGGIRWQLEPSNFGYDYKDSFSNANFIELAARLARYTGNSTYNDWAVRGIEWMTKTGLVVQGGVFDSALVNTNCSKVVPLQWTGDTGSLLSGTAYLGNATQSERWSDFSHIIFSNASANFAAESVITEVVCARHLDNCTGQYTSLRSIFARGLARSRDLLGSNVDQIDKILRASASAAVRFCVDGSNGLLCTWDDADFTSVGKVGQLGQKITALELVLALLRSPKLVTAT